MEEGLAALHHPHEPHLMTLTLGLTHHLIGIAPADTPCPRCNPVGLDGVLTGARVRRANSQTQAPALWNKPRERYAAIIAK
jgi:hypothetical protein